MVLKPLSQTVQCLRQHHPAVNGTRIVWDDQTNPLGHIFIYDIATGNITRIVNNPAAQYYPSISGNLTVWQDARNGGWDIYMYNLTDQTEHEITSSHSAQHPAISGDKIVWQDGRSGHWNIYMYNITEAKEYLITPEAVTYDTMLPAISGNLIVWGDYRYDPTDTKPVVFMNDTYLDDIPDFIRYHRFLFPRRSIDFQ